MTVAIALSSASGVGSRSPALIRGTRASAVRLAQHLGVAPLKSEAYGKRGILSRAAAPTTHRQHFAFIKSERPMGVGVRAVVLLLRTTEAH